MQYPDNDNDGVCHTMLNHPWPSLIRFASSSLRSKHQKPVSHIADLVPLHCSLGAEHHAANQGVQLDVQGHHMVIRACGGPDDGGRGIGLVFDGTVSALAS